MTPDAPPQFDRQTDDAGRGEPRPAGGALRVGPLAAGGEREALDFLSPRPVHTVVMSSLIGEHGLESARNRGTFYGCRSATGRLEGVALLGHVTLFEARSREALRALACAARSQQQRPHVILGERAKAREFWSAYADGVEPPHRSRPELLFELSRPIRPGEDAQASPDGDTPALRLATLADAPLAAEAHAELIERQSGVNPMACDAEGFAARTARRIERGRVWVWVRDGRLVFKADVVAETPEVIYLEGVYVRPEERGRGHGLRCLTRLSRELLARAARICLLVSADNVRAQEFYRRAGYRHLSDYETIFLRP
ncbi:MAG TPA: GNAT family N-acetyltransferase [Pyrinomonadaceae bacterium]|nr:GNAT family N-acetyltransferase [Pyrinomonadaceae bacterium]